MGSLNAVFSFNVRLLWVFHLGVLMGPNYCSVHAKKQIKVRLSEGGGIQSDFLSKGVVFHGFNSCLKVLVGAGTKNKPLMKAGNSSSLKVWLGRL